MGFSRTGPFGDQNSGDTISASAADQTPNGLLGGDRSETNHSSITLSTLLSSTCDVGASRFIKVSVCGRFRATDNALVSTSEVTAISEVQTTIMEDGTPIQRINWQSAVSTQDNGFAVFGYSNGPSSGSHVYAFQFGVSGSYAGPVTLMGSTGSAAILLVEDIGPSV